MEIGNATLYLGDCRKVAFDRDAIGAIITDPPYGISYRHSGSHGYGARCHTAEKRGNPAVVGDDGAFDPAPWLELCGNVIMWGADHFYPRLPNHGRWLAWNKLGDMEPWDSFSDVEFAWHSWEGAARVFSMKWKGMACEKGGEDNGRRHHTTQKPIRLMRWCIEQSRVLQGTPILDPYMGSGTTGIAAAMAGHPFIGVEIDETYFTIACERIENAQRQERLFA